jgi:hypothetical protein
MTLPTSSISISRYAVALCGTAALVVTLCVGIISVAAMLGRPAFPNQVLLNYQLEKIGGLIEPDTIFVGDSSLGYAIDASVWSALDGRPALNLALTGNFGYAGSYNMIRRVLAWHHPRRVIVMNAAWILWRPVPDDAYWITASNPISIVIGYWRLSIGAKQVDESVSWLLANGMRALRQGQVKPTDPGSIIVNDYMLQGWQAVSDMDLHPWDSGYLRSDEPLRYLKMIAELCDIEHIECVYAHGPLAEPICSNSTAYFARAANMIRSTGIKFVDASPICIPESEIGNADVHVRPDLKAAYTRKYYAILK